MSELTDELEDLDFNILEYANCTDKMTREEMIDQFDELLEAIEIAQELLDHAANIGYKLATTGRIE